MDLCYHFFDRAAFDQIWALTWPAFRKKWNGSSWARKPLKERGGYCGDSLKELIAFCVEPEPSDHEIEDILARRTVRWTAQHSASQFYFLENIMQNIPKLRNRQFSAVVFADGDFVVLLSAAVDAYFESRIQRNTLRAVLSLHPVKGLDEYLDLTQAERKVLGPLMRAQPDMLKPLYKWQGPQAFSGEEWVGCLGESDTRRFAAFVVEAWSRNWSVSRVKEPNLLSSCPRRGQIPRFRDFAISKELTESLNRHVKKLVRPCVIQSLS